MQIIRLCTIRVQSHGNNFEKIWQPPSQFQGGVQKSLLLSIMAIRSQVSCSQLSQLFLHVLLPVPSFIRETCAVDLLNAQCIPLLKGSNRYTESVNWRLQVCSFPTDSKSLHHKNFSNNTHPPLNPCESREKYDGFQLKNKTNASPKSLRCKYFKSVGKFWTTPNIIQRILHFVFYANVIIRIKFKS